MNVVRHEHGKIAKPILFLIINPNGIENGWTNDILAKVVLLSRLGAKSHKVIGVRRHPVGRFVIKTLAWGHGLKGVLW